MGPKIDRGTALILVLLLVPILVFLARSVAWLASSSHFRSVVHRQEVSSTYIMEAGMAHAQTKLEENADWKEGFRDEKMAHVGGTYSVSFQDLSQPYVDGNSVNNIRGVLPADGPRGPDTVNPGTLELVVNVKNAATESRGTFILAATLSQLPASAVATDGRILMEGDVNVSGVANLKTWAGVRSGIHSNVFGTGDSAIAWSPKDAGDQARFTGKVTTSSRNDDALAFSGVEGTDYIASEFETGAPSVSVPSPDILTEVRSKTTAEQPLASQLGTTTLTGRDFYDPDGLTIQGDLVLDGGNLYVEGDLTVNGSITGEGSVYVTGKTAFKGDALIEASKTGVALYSHDSIELSGFDGLEYMNAIKRSEPGIAANFRVFASAMAEASDTTPDKKQNKLAARAAGAVRNISAIVDRRLPPGNKTGDMVREQLRSYSGVIMGAERSRKGMSAATRRVTHGLNRLGTSYFQGLLVTNSHIHASNSVSVVGSVFANGKNTESENKNVGSTTLKAGDIYLADDSEVLFNKALIDDPDLTAKNMAKLELRSWSN